MNPTPSPSLQINGITCEIYLGPHGQDGGIVETWTEKGLEVTVTFICKWSDRIALIQALRGAISWDGESPGVWNRKEPFTLPLNNNDMLPDLDQLSGNPYQWQRFVCYSTSPFRPIKPRVDHNGDETGLTGWVYYDAVIFDAHFAVPTYYTGARRAYTQGFDLSRYPYTTTTTKVSGEVFIPATNSFKFAAATNQPIDEAHIGLIRPRTEITVTRHYMPAVDTNTLEEAIGTINDVPMNFGTEEYPSESVMYLSYDVETYGDPSTGLNCFDIKHTLMANGTILDNSDPNNPNEITSWNYYLRPDGVWDKLVDKKTGTQTPYRRKNFIAAIWPEY